MRILENVRPALQLLCLGVGSFLLAGATALWHVGAGAACLLAIGTLGDLEGGTLPLPERFRALPGSPHGDAACSRAEGAPTFRESAEDPAGLPGPRDTP